MKSTKEMIEVMQAFEDGKKIEYRRQGLDFAYDGWVYVSKPAWDWINLEYRVVSEWYENIPGGGVLCWVWDRDGEKTIMSIVEYDPAWARPFHPINGISWEHATPLTQQEIQTFLNNAKDIGV